MSERVIIPDEVFLLKKAGKWADEVIEAEGYRIFEMKPAQVYDIGVERRLRRKKPIGGNDVA